MGKAATIRVSKETALRLEALKKSLRAQRFNEVIQMLAMGIQKLPETPWPD
jgi:hypothetical protein